MAVEKHTISLATRGFCDIVDITAQVEGRIQDSALQDGIATVFVGGSTASVSTIEYESGAIRDLQEAIEKIAPQEGFYHHNARWGDGNGFSHVRSALLGPSITLPFEGKQMMLGTWQQIIFIDFDNRSRNRQVIVQLIGE